MNIGLLRGGSTPLCAVIQMSTAPQTVAGRRGREGRLYLDVAVTGEPQLARCRSPSTSVVLHASGLSGPFLLSSHPAVVTVSTPHLHFAFRYASIISSSESSLSQSQLGFHSSGTIDFD